jgi:hypothetical protein
MSRPATTCSTQADKARAPKQPPLSGSGHWQGGGHEVSITSQDKDAGENPFAKGDKARAPKKPPLEQPTGKGHRRDPKPSAYDDKDPTKNPMIGATPMAIPTDKYDGY